MSFFSPESSNTGSSPIELIPAGTLVKAVLVVRDIKNSNNTGARYLDIEMVIQGGQYDNRRVFTVICDPWDDRTNEKAKEMAIGSITRLMEQTGVFRVGDTASYSALDHSNIQDVAVKLQGKTVGFSVGIQKGKDGYADKNSVRDWASPNPQSHGYKLFEAIAAGQTTLSKTPAAPAAFGGGAPAQPAQPRPAQPAGPATATPAWLQQK